MCNVMKMKSSPSKTNLSAAVVTLFTLETLLIPVSLLMLNESITLMENSITVAAFLSRLNEGVLLSQMNTWYRNDEMVRQGATGPRSIYCVWYRTYQGHFCVQWLYHSAGNGISPRSLCASAECASSWYHSVWIEHGRCSIHMASHLQGIQVKKKKKFLWNSHDHLE